MYQSSETPTLVTKVRVPAELTKEFVNWQTKLNTIITTFPGFISIEIITSQPDTIPVWTMVQRFNKMENFVAWSESKQHRELIEELKALLNDGSNPIQETEFGYSNLKGGVTEVFVTEVNPDKEDAYRKWVAKIHQVESTFPGFRGMYVQSPTHCQGKNWITLLQFDTPENLDRWLSSPERAQVLKESKPLISFLESHRVYSPYGGWFTAAEKAGNIIPVWKQTMVVLLVLFPIVMLEMKFLNPVTSGLNLSLGIFIGNVISVSLLAWPMMPIALWLLDWWLNPKTQKMNVIGTVLVLLLYLFEIAIFWKLL